LHDVKKAGAAGSCTGLDLFESKGAPALQALSARRIHH
jgi:hypothetical protein